MKEQIKQAAEFNAMAGILAPKDAESIDWVGVDVQLGLIREELAELEHAVIERDSVEQRDALADLLVVIYGAAIRLGVADKLPSDFQAVHESNMSKFCTSWDEYQQTIKKYEAICVEITHRTAYGMIAAISAKEQTGTDGKEYPMGKILKGINYHKPVLEG